LPCKRTSRTTTCAIRWRWMCSMKNSAPSSKRRSKGVLPSLKTSPFALDRDAVQTHIKNNYMRNPLAMDVFNEELCTLLKKKIKGSVTKLEDLTIRFGYNGEVTLKDTQEILDKITGVHRQVVEAAERTTDAQRREALNLFAENLARSFYGFEPDFFQQNVTRIVDDVVSVIQASLELWPTLVEICYFHKDKKEFPQIRVKNKKLASRENSR